MSSGTLEFSGSSAGGAADAAPAAGWTPVSSSASPAAEETAISISSGSATGSFYPRRARGEGGRGQPRASIPTVGEDAPHNTTLETPALKTPVLNIRFEHLRF